MFKFADKLSFKKDATLEIRVMGILPAGSGIYKEKSLKLDVNGFTFILSERKAKELFDIEESAPDLTQDEIAKERRKKMLEKKAIETGEVLIG